MTGSEMIISIRDYPEYLEAGVNFFASKWGYEKKIYEDCISHSICTPGPLPRWYLLLKDERIIGGFGLITNDFISRQDLYPWLCAIYVEKEERGRGLGGLMLAHGRKEAAMLGFPALYLSTDHTGYYERYGWVFIGTGYGPDGSGSRIYMAECPV